MEFHGWSQVPGIISEWLVLRGWLLDVVVELVLRSKGRFLQFKVMVVILVQLLITHNLNDYYSPFMQISSNLFDRDFHNNMLINLSTSSATQAHNSSTPDGQKSRHSSASISTCSFGLINCRPVCNKTLVVKDLVVDKDIDILGITETWLHGNDSDNPALANLVPNSYFFRDSARHDSRSVGVGLMFKKSLNVNFSCGWKL